MRLRTRQRISRQADFAAVRQKGRRVFTAAFVFSVFERAGSGRLDLPRFAVVASRKVGPAHVRNLLKRRLRAVFRESQDRFPGSLDLVVTLKPAAAELSFAELEKSFAYAARKSGFGPKARPSVSPPTPEPSPDVRSAPQ
jgi:ribonuclease P protein component